MSGDFLGLLERLVKASVDFVIVGGFGGVVHGCTYVTQDIDICCDFSVENLLRLRKAVSGLHPVHRMAAEKQKLELTEENCSQFKNLYLDTDIGQLDCLSFIDGVGDYKKARDKSVSIEANDIRLHVLNIDALIKSKRTMNRPRDKETVIQLEALKKLKQQHQLAINTAKNCAKPNGNKSAQPL